MTIVDKLYVAIKSMYDKDYDLNYSSIPKEVELEHVDIDDNLVITKTKNLAMKKKEVDDFIKDTKVTPTVSVESDYPFELDLTDLDANTMYPVYFRFGYSGAESREIGEINIGRRYGWNRRSPSPFSDNTSTSHIAGLNLIIRGNDHPWGGEGWNGIKVILYNYRYMNTVQLFTSHRIPVYIQAKDDTRFVADNSVPPTEGCPMYSGFYLRGGLLYKGFTKGMTVQPKLITEPTRLYNNGAYNRSEWIAPFPYNPDNNISQINYGE